MVEKYGKKVRELMVKEIKDVLTENKGVIFSSVDRIKAADIDKLRKTMRQAGSRYLIVKNKLAQIALEEVKIDGLTDTVKEKKTLGIGIIKEDPVQIAKLLMEFAKKNKGFSVSNGYLDGRSMEAERVKALSELPGREQLLAMVVGMMNAPISSFVGVLSSVLRSVLYALNAVKEKKEKE